MVGVGAIHHHEGLDLPGQRRLLGQVAHAGQVAFALFAHVGRQQQAAAGTRAVWRTPFQTRAMASRAARPAPLSATPGPRKRPSASTEISSFPRGRDNGIEVRGKGDVGAVAIGRDHVAGLIDSCIPTQGAELFQEPRGALPSRKVGAGTRQSARWISLIHWRSRVSHWRHSRTARLSASSLRLTPGAAVLAGITYAV